MVWGLAFGGSFQEQSGTDAYRLGAWGWRSLCVCARIDVQRHHLSELDLQFWSTKKHNLCFLQPFRPIVQVSTKLSFGYVYHSWAPCTFWHCMRAPGWSREAGQSAQRCWCYQQGVQVQQNYPITCLEAADEWFCNISSMLEVLQGLVTSLGDTISEDQESVVCHP